MTGNNHEYEKVINIINKYKSILPKLKKINITKIIGEYLQSSECVTPPFVFGATTTGLAQPLSTRLYTTTQNSFIPLKLYVHIPEFDEEKLSGYLLKSPYLVGIFENFYHHLVKNVMSDTPITELTHDNILSKAVEFVHVHYEKIDVDEHPDDLVYILTLMLSSPDFILSDEFCANKLNLREMQIKFQRIISPTDMSRDDVIEQVFGYDNM